MLEQDNGEAGLNKNLNQLSSKFGKALMNVWAGTEVKDAKGKKQTMRIHKSLA